MELLISPINAADVSAVAAIHAASWRSAYRGMLGDDFLDGDIISNRLNLWTQRLTPLPPTHYGFVATVERQPIGFSFALGNHDPHWGTQIDNLHVLPGFKSRGVGRSLLTALCRRIDEVFGESGIYLWVYEQNWAARGFYEKLGATLIERATIAAPGGGTVSECRYAWKHPRQLLAACAVGTQS